MHMHLWHYDLPEHAQHSGDSKAPRSCFGCEREQAHEEGDLCIQSYALRTPSRHREAGAKDARVAQPEGANRSGPACQL